MNSYQIVVFFFLCIVGGNLLAQKQVEAIFVGNNKAGTVSIINSKTFEVEKTIDIAPDRKKKQKQSIINKYINKKLGAKYVDDLDLLPDGKTMVVSRPFFADIAAFDLNSNALIWTLKLKKRPDHQVITKDGKYLFVSLLTAKKGVKIDLVNQKIMGYYKTGRRPHGIVLNKEETKVYNGALKGNDIVVVDTKTLQETNRITLPDGVRPFKISDDEHYIYTQLSYCHCLVEYNLLNNKIERKIELPVPDFVKNKPLEEYPFEAAHHGIGFSKNKDFISLAGTVSNYVAILTFPELELVKTLDAGIEPSWITDGFDGDTFFVSSRGSNKVFAYSYQTQQLIKEIEVDDYPQRMARGIWHKE